MVGSRYTYSWQPHAHGSKFQKHVFFSMYDPYNTTASSNIFWHWQQAEDEEREAASLSTSRPDPLFNIFMCVANPYQERAAYDETSTSAPSTVQPACKVYEWKVILDARSIFGWSQHLLPSYNPGARSVHLQEGQSFLLGKHKDLISGSHCI